jgi:hypothetical protein
MTIEIVAKSGITWSSLCRYLPPAAVTVGLDAGGA